ncbi:MAG: TonB-dependent receptor [Gammaproteobacteria bacterium]
MKRRDPIAAAVRHALCATVAVGLAVPALAQAQDGEEAAELERVEVTGSRIKRTDIEGALPVTVIDREEIELSGHSSAADFIRQLPFNSQGSYRPQSGSSFGGAAAVSLRGLGSDRTLVLVNGRRMPKTPLAGSFTDINTIPIAAVERIEILTDGASAIYGSDAIGGVINVILREDFTGAELMLGAAQPSIPDNGGDRTEGSVTFGASNATTSLIGGASWNTRDIVFARDYPWTTPGASVYGNSFTTLTDGIDNFDWTSLPGACDFEGSAFFTLQAPGAVPNSAGETTRCAYDFTRVSADEASYDTRSAFVRAEHEFTPNWAVFSDIWYSRTESFGRYAPVPDSTYFGAPLTADSPNNPTNPASPFYDPAFGAPQQVNIWHRFDALGNRDNFIDTELTDLLVGVKGMIGEVEVEAGWRDTKNKVYDIGYNYLVRTTAFNYMEDGTYDLADPYANPDNVLNAMKATISRISRYNQWEAYANAGWDMFELPAGPIQWFVGAEYREIDYNDQYDSLSEAGQIGGSAGNSAGGTRDVTAAYFETLIPILPGLEASVAGRYDDYSDYGDDFSPKVSFRWQPFSELTLRGSYGEGFRAPTLDIITQLDAFSADSVFDEQTCLNQSQPADCNVQVNAVRTANPDLQSEQSTQYSFGVAYAPFNWLNGTLDYWDIEIEERIAFFSSQNLIDREISGDPIPPGLGVVRAPNGSILNIVTGYGNEGTVETSGIDLNVMTTFDFFGGTLSNNLLIAYTLDYSVDGGRDLVEDPGVPEYRAILNNTYAWRDFSFGWNINVIGSQFDAIVDGQGEGHVPTWVTHDLQANYFTPWDGRITIGALNVGEKNPPIGVGFLDGRDYDFNLYNADGRLTYIRYTQSF